MKKASFLILIFCCYAAMGFAQSKAVSSPYVVNPGPEPGVYESVRMDLGSQVTEAQVRSAVFQRYPLLEAFGHQLEPTHYRESPGGKHYTYTQKVNQIPLYESGVKVNLDPQGNVISMMNWLNVTPAKIRGDFVFSQADAEAWAERNLPNGDRFGRVWGEKTYFPDGEALVPAYRVQTEGDGYQTYWEVLVDANSLKEIMRKDRAVYRKPTAPPPPPPANGRGFVFNPDPVTTGNTFYGSNWEYTDRDDSISPALDNARILVTLKDITEDNGTYYLEGPYVEINDHEQPNIPPATSTNGDFFAQRSHFMFEDVNTYFWIDSLQRFVQRIGFNNLATFPILADPHGVDDSDNSHFVAPDRVAFGRGGVDDAEDVDVIVHEYGHALSNSASPSTNSGFERKGLDEGIGDYIAAMWSYGIDPYAWENVFSWDGHNEYWPGRSANVSYTYPPPTGVGGFYNYGELWATVLMEAHNHPDIGRWVNNKCFFESLYGNAVNGTLHDAAMLILDADSILFNEAHEAEYRDIFCSRSILTGQECVVVTGLDDLGQGLGIGVYPNPAKDFVNVGLEGFQPGMELDVVIASLTGQELLRQPIQLAHTQLSTAQFTRGVYLLQIRQGSGILKTKKLVIQ